MTDLEDGEHYEITVKKIKGSAFTNDGKHACLRFVDDKDNAFELNIPTRQAHTAATAILAAASSAAPLGKQSTPIVETSQIGASRNAQAPNELFVQTLFFAEGGHLSFQFDRACAGTLVAALRDFLDGKPPPETIAH